MSLIEIFATFFGLICVFLTIKENIWCWPAGIIQVFLFIFIFYDARLYSDMLLHIIYVFFNFYGWYNWHYLKSDTEVMKVTTLGNYLIYWIAACAIGTLGLAMLMESYTNASLPYPDSFIAASSLLAQWLMAKKKLESWYFWILADVVAIVIYFIKELYLTSGLYAIFLVLATIGYLEWRKSFYQLRVDPLAI
jgi:nicotinamide mononucleotide transporter